LVTAFKNEDSSASVLTSFLFGEYPTLNYQLNYSDISPNSDTVAIMYPNVSLREMEWEKEIF
jgi:hypothetical protein